jgi:long-chain acyl-CoA synthetase
MATLSIAAVLAEAARRYPDKTAVIAGAERLAFPDLWRDARRVGQGLVDRGVQPGDRIALLAPNVLDFIRGYYGILACGGVVVPVPTLLKPAEVAYVVQNSGSRFVLTHHSYAAVADEACADSTAQPLRIDELAAGPEALPTYLPRGAEDPAVIFYTSGTTGRPKGAVITHLNLITVINAYGFDANGVYDSDIVLGALPLFHAFGQVGALNATFRIGATLVLQERFDAAEALVLMGREKVTNFLGVPTMYVHLLNAAKTVEILPTTLRVCSSGGASLPVAVLEEFESTFGTTIFEGYGLSETSPTACLNQRRFGARPGSVGHPIWGVEVEIADDLIEDAIVLKDTGELGEVVVRGPNVFSGYLDDPAATAEVLVDGWFRTGDIGRKDEDGFLWIVDRKKDLIIRGGFNVYPREVEEVLMRHPGVSQVAVLGIPDPTCGEEVCAVIVPTDGTGIDPDDLIAWSRTRLGSHKYPRRIEVFDSLPLGPTHKILKRELKALL